MNTAQGAATISRWADGGRAWGRYDDLRPGSGYTGAWVNLCQNINQGPLTQADVLSVLDLIWDRDPGIPVWLSPLNYYTDDDCAQTGGNLIPDQGAVLADMISSQHSDVHRGPDLGPLSDSMTSDNCHPNAAGEALVGGQLEGFFDE